MKSSLALLFIFFTFVGFSQEAISAKPIYNRGTLSLLDQIIDVKHYQLFFDVDINAKTISGSNTMTFICLKQTDSLELDLKIDISIDSILYEKKKLSFARDSNRVVVLGNFAENKTQNLKIFFGGKPQIALNAPWDEVFTWKEDSLHRPFIGVTCEGYGASSWWPCKDHPTDEPDSVTVSIKVDSSLIAVSNGRLIEQKLTYNKRIFTWKVTNPINLYNITMNIGKYAFFEESYFTQNQKKLALQYFVLDYRLNKAKKHFEQVKPMLKIFEEIYGEYPYINDCYKLVESPYWGMEHQSNVAYGNHYNNNNYDFDFIILHESAHEYWGNSISATDHAFLYIHEAFTTYTEALFIEKKSGTERMLAYLKEQKSNIKNRTPILGTPNQAYNNWDDADMYYKGTWMLHTLRNQAPSDSAWYAQIKNLYQHFKGRVISSDSLVEYFDKNVIPNSKSVFNHYLNKLYYPTLQYKLYAGDSEQFLVCRYSTVGDDFQMPLKLYYTDGTFQEINPKVREYQKFNIPFEKKIDFDKLENHYLVNFEKIKGNKGVRIKKSGRIIF